LVSGVSFTMEGGFITGNCALRGGGGVYVRGADGAFIMNGGTISDNSANIAGEFGGGVFLRWDAISFTMHGGIIAGNTAGTGGGGVAVEGGTFIKAPVNEGDASGIIYGNDGSANRNKATLGETTLNNDKGHAVYISATQKRETTVLPDQRLDSADPGTAGGWVD